MVAGMIDSFDVLVAGGGSAGLAAAVSAARAGASTLLVERAGTAGGMATAALVHTICGLFRVHSGPEPKFANDGFAREFAERLRASGGAAAPVRMGRVDVLPHDPAAFASLADVILCETGNLRVWFHTELASAAHRDGAWQVETLCRGRRRTISARAVVDATGDAAFTALAGAAFEQTPADKLQRPAYICQLRGMPREALSDEARLRLAHGLVRAVKDGALPAAALGAGFRAGLADGVAFLTIDLAGDSSLGPWDPLCPAALTAVEQTGRATARAVAEFLGRNVAGCERAGIAAWPARAGVRESRRICARHMLTGDDIRTGAQFPDAIAAAAWPMELRERPTGPRLIHAESDGPADIPVRCLQHAEIGTLFAAGRCLGSTHEAQASIRVMGTCLATGEAAGLAAAWVGDALAAESLAERIRHWRAERHVQNAPA